MNRRNFFGRFGAAVIAASLYPVDFVLRHSRKLKATWTMTTREMEAYHTSGVLDQLVLEEHARMLRDAIDADILKLMEEKYGKNEV